MSWILIMTLWTWDGVTMNSAGFVTKADCLVAGAAWKKQVTGGRVYRVEALCAYKGN